jgi:cytoskeletal protein CcmA (bactofilin family)
MSHSESTIEREQRAVGGQVSGAFAGTHLSSESSCDGKIVLSESAVIAGDVAGEIFSEGPLFIEKSAHLNARIFGRSVVVAGNLRGSIQASERIELLSTATVIGDLTSAILVVHQGALLEGNCAVLRPSEGDIRAEVAQSTDMASTGFSFFITAKQKAELRNRGYDDVTISQMRPAEAHRLLGLA